MHSGIINDDAISNQDFAKRTAVSALSSGTMMGLLYPVRLAKVLAKLGYIPWELAGTVEIGGGQMYKVPSITQYINYVYSEEGPSGLTRGQFSAIVGSIVYTFTEKYTQLLMCEKLRGQPSALMSEYKKIVKTTVISTAVAVVLSHPLEVLSYRQVAQFVGKEELYSGCLPAVRHLFFGPGVYALFDSLIPRYVFHLLYSLSTNLLGKTYEHYLDGRLSWLNPGISNDFIASHFYTAPTLAKFVLQFLSGSCIMLNNLQPFEAITVTSSTANSGLLVGEPPFNANVGCWISRFGNMLRTHQLYRNSDFWSTTFTEYPTMFTVW